MPFGEILLKMAAQQALSDDEKAILRLVGNQIELNSTVVDGWASTGGTVAPTFNYATLSYPKFITDILVFLGSTVTTRIDADGDIFFGSNVASPGTTSFVVFSNAQTYNGESVGAGDLLIGDNSSGKGNIFWDQSAGVLYFRTGTTALNQISTGALSADGCRIRRTTDQTISNSTDTRVSFDTEDYDDSGFANLGANATRITIPSGRDGRYEIGGNVSFKTGGGAGSRALNLVMNGDYTTVLGGSTCGGTANPVHLNAVIQLNLVAGDYLELQVNQQSGGNLDIAAAGQPSLRVYRLR